MMIQLIFRSLTQPHGQLELHQPADCVRHVICLGQCNRSTVKVSIRRKGFVGNELVVPLVSLKLLLLLNRLGQSYLFRHFTAVKT